MLFNSLDFAIFLPIVFFLYWFVTNRNLKLQNFLIVAASYVFYGWWDWRFLTLILLSTLVDYSIGYGLGKVDKSSKRKALLWASVLVNLGLLGFFKYYNFFLENFVNAFTFLGGEIKVSSLNIILPVGISFYTFQTLSYTIDIYKRKLEPTKDLIAFSAFVSFFPQLVAGPIERASNLLPQFYKKRIFEYDRAVDGMRQILWGLFKKIVIADNCARFANQIFNNYTELNSSSLVLGVVFFSFQIYGDFSGYSDIAIGTSRLFGFNLMQNFATPYFSRDISEFWRRWHISLTTWLRDYVFIPLTINRNSQNTKVSTVKKIRNTFIIFILSGLWHGANWTFIVWGAINAFYFLPILLNKKKSNSFGSIAQGRFFPKAKDLINIFQTYSLVAFGMIFFRSENIEQAINYVSRIFSSNIIELPALIDNGKALTVLLLIGLFIIIEWLGREGKYAIETIVVNFKPFFRYVFYYLIVLAILWFGGKEQTFIYFQF